MLKQCFIFLLSIFLITSCTDEPKKIHIGFNTWAGYQAVAIADKKRFFEQEGLNVHVKQYAVLKDVKEAFAADKIDVMFSTLDEVLLLANQGVKLKMVLVADYSNGADAIVAQPEIKSIKDLKGKKVGVELGTISHFLLLKALQKAKLNEQDVSLVPITEQNALTTFSNKSVDAITTWSPYTQQAVKAGGHVIFSSANIPFEIVDVMAIRQDLLDRHPDNGLKLISAYMKTLDWLQHHQEEGLKMMADSANMSEAEFKEALKGVHMTNLKENLDAFGSSHAEGSLYTTTKNLMQFLLNKKIISKVLTTEDLIDSKLIWEYARKQERV